MPKAVDVDLKLDQFMSASVDVIASEGLSAASLRKISQQAGCTTGALTHYFANRDELLLQTLRYVHNNAGARMQAIIANEVAAAQSNRDKLRAVLDESLPLDLHRYREWRVWLAFWSASMQTPALSKENARRYQQWQGLVQDLLARLLPAETLPLETARLINLIDGLGVSIVRERWGSSACTNRRIECQQVMAMHLQQLTG